MEAAKLKEILDKHLHWIRGDVEGWEYMKADLSGADLSGANLSGADLYEANLSGANLSGADLYGANLSRADLSVANLSGANLSGANLYEAGLYEANLSRADLSGANLSGADLYKANLSGANLYRANLYEANLSRADLYRATLSGADLYGTNLELELLNKFCPICCPDTGEFIGWKKCRKGYIVKLKILADAKRSSAYRRKCRCSAAEVLAIEYESGDPADTDTAVSSYNGEFKYKVGEIVKVDNFDEDRRNECSTGIHFFITRQEAVDYEG